MKVARILSPVHSLGPGNRVCLWTQGCSKQCRGCIAPELQKIGDQDIPERILADVIRHAAKNGSCTGLTISGGDPFEQSESLLSLLHLVRGSFSDILVYTGYTIEEIMNGAAGQEGTEALENIDVLIDGRYLAERNTSDCVLRGSDNQIIHYLTPSFRATYEEYMKQGRMLETFQHNGSVIITGIQNEEQII